MDDDLRNIIMSILRAHRGIENRISRARLRAEASFIADRYVADRELRRAIHDLRETPGDGSLIVSTCGSLDEDGNPLPARKAGSQGTQGAPGGYFMVENLAELKRYLKPDENRALDTLQRIKRQKLAAGMALGGVEQLPIPTGIEIKGTA